LKEEALDRTQWRTRFGKGYGPVVRQTTDWMKLTEKCTATAYRKIAWQRVARAAIFFYCLRQDLHSAVDRMDFHIPSWRVWEKHDRWSELGYCSRYSN
jgi:hypothetical protein